MLKQMLFFLTLVLIIHGCTKPTLPFEELSNRDKMNQLVIQDPGIWNSLSAQLMEIDTAQGSLKAGTGMTKMKEYPNKGYYYAVFEDLYPSQGDYDFNDIMLQTKLFLDGKKGEVWGKLSTTVIHRGGTLGTKLGLMFYSVKGNKEYTAIDYRDILVNGQRLSGDEPFTMDLPPVGENFEVEYFVEDRTNNINQIWISWHIVVSSGENETEIHTAGFPDSGTKEFEIPQRDFLTINNLPWGLEIEAEEFFIPKEKEVFLNVFPEFREWAETGGVKNKSWYKNPDRRYIQ